MPRLPKNTLRSDKIAQAAGRLFAYQGYHGTSTRQIAHLAGVSENTLFRYFDNKESLFWTTLLSYSKELEFRRDLMEGIAKCAPPVVVLPKILELLTDTVSYRPELIRLIAVAFIELGPKAAMFSQEHLSPALSAIRRYLEMNIKSESIRDLDPVMLTTALMMTTLTHATISPLIDHSKPLLSYQEVNRAHTRFWLDLLAPKASAFPQPVAEIAAEHPT